MFRGLITIWCSIHIFLGFLFAVIIGKFVTYYIFTAPTVKELIQLSKCPACFGVNICPEFMKHQININGFSLYTTVVNKFGPGNIFYGLYEDQRVVLKKLGNIWEVNEVDKKICLHIGLSPDCNVGNTLWHPEDFYETVKQLLTLPVIQSDGQIEFNKFHVCPSTENLELLLHRYYHINKSINRKILSINIWFMVLLNPEPLILQTILKEDDSPIPKYYGACGRVVVEEYVGDTLTYFYNSPWLKRVHITYQLLMAATYFTERHPYFNFYLTDISPDNIAVNDAGIIKFIDLENVIVVDRTVTNIVDGVVLLDDDYMRDRKIFGQVVCSFRYGREEDEVMGLNFQKDLHLVSEQIYPQKEKSVDNVTKLQERLLKKLGPNAIPFTFSLPSNAPASVTLQPGPEDLGDPCGVQYYVKIFAGDTDTDRTHKRSTVNLGIRKVQYAPSKQGRQPCTLVRKDFMLSPGELELEATLDKQVYHHGERISVNICVRNNSNKVVKKIKAMVQQGVDIVLFQNGQYRTTVASMETQEGCPIQPGSSLQKTMYLVPALSSNKGRRGVALDGQVKYEDTGLASSTLLAVPEERDPFGIIVSYTVKVKLYLGALGGELSAELPFLLMYQKPEKMRLIHADSQAEVETFRQDTVDCDNM